MKMDKQALAKHHFWILLGAFALFALILLIVIPVTVGGIIDDKQNAISAMSTGLDGKRNPKNKGQLAAMQQQTESLGGRRETLHKEMFSRQQDLLSFPQELANLNKLNFGAEIPRKERSDYRQQDIYAREYEEMGTILKPTELVGGWRSILAPVVWDTSLFPLTEEVWLSLEDMCVRREMLQILQDANMSVARFTPKTPLASGPAKLPLQRKFESRLWEVDLVLAKKDRDYVFKGKLKNISGKRQGNIYQFYLDVWVSDDFEGARPIRLPIEQESLGAGQEMEIPETKVVINQVPTGLYKVEQELNDRFVPIKQLKVLLLGKNAGHRMADKPLKMAKFSQEATASTTTTPGAPGGERPGTGSSIGGPPPGMTMGPPGGKPGLGLPPGLGGGAGGTAGSTEETPNHIAKNRYIDMTDQVRRMPVAFVIVVDQSNINDVLIALSNSSRMRFQTTQTHMQRMYGVTTGGGSSHEPGGFAGSPSGPPTAGMPTMPGPGGGKPTAMTPGLGTGGAPPPVGSSAMSGPPRGIGMGTDAPRGGSGRPTEGPASSSAPASTSSSGGEVQHAGLVEMTVYGVANIYERPKEAAAAPGAPASPAAPSAAPSAVGPKPATTPATPATPPGPGDKPAATFPPEKPADKPAEKAGDKPADKPAGKAGDKPAEKASDKPSEKPAGKAGDKPTDHPADKPADKTPSTPPKPMDPGGSKGTDQKDKNK